uniref:WAT1-related protein n=1 Tax=Davidia involucrata TaxID=16924 RepID=A0A5B7BPD0_DAVIN
MKAFLRCVVAMEKNKPYIAMIFIQFVYTGMSLFSKAAISEGMKPSVFVAYRQGFATLALAPFAFFFERKTAPPLTCSLLCKIFFVSLCGITLSLNLYYYGMNYTSATFATAITNTIPAMVFIMAIVLRMESVSLREWHGIAKVLGSVVGLSGATVFTFYKGPAIYHGIEKENPDPSTSYSSKGDWIKEAYCQAISSKTTTYNSTVLLQLHTVSTLGCCSK